MALVYETLVETPHRPEEIVEKIREVAWPRLHITIEATDRRDLARTLDELNVALQALGHCGLDVDAFSRGVPGSRFNQGRRSS